MRLALECPTELLSDIQPLADFDFILCHLVLQDEEYANYYKRSTRLKILDNSTNELLHPCSLDEIKRAADIVQPDYVVSPDFLGDHFSTEKGLDDTIKLFGKEKVLPVVQGSELKYVLECAEYITKKRLYRVAVPYDLTCSRKDSLEKMADARREVVEKLLQLDFQWIHLLGMTTLEELENYNNWDIVGTIDTGSPVMHGMRRKKFGVDNLLPKDKPTLTQMGRFYPTTRSTIYYNIAYLRKVLNGN